MKLNCKYALQDDFGRPLSKKKLHWTELNRQEGLYLLRLLQ